MKLLMLIAEGLEECEALVTRDVLLRGQIAVDLVSINGDLKAVSQNNYQVIPDLAKLPSLDDYQGIILPGGGRGTQNLNHYFRIDELLKHFASNKKLVAAICAAPSVVGLRGYYKNRRYTCFKGCNQGIDGIYTANPVEVDGDFISARSMYYAADFALAIIEYFKGKEIRKQVENSIKSI